MPFEANLRGRIYDAQGNVVGEEPIQVQPDVEGDLGGPGTFVGDIPYQVRTPGPGEVEIAEISARDGSIVVSATVAVTLTATPFYTRLTVARSDVSHGRKNASDDYR